MGVRHFHMHPEGERRRWQDPEETLARVGLEPRMTFVDVGCGNGFFALPAARIVGPEGRVIGVDADAQLLVELAMRAAAEGLSCLETVVGRAEETVPCRGCADVVFIGNALHDFEDPARVLANAALMLGPGGRLADVDWSEEPSPVGPPLAIRFSPARARALIEAAGLVPGEAERFGRYHYLIIARKT